MWFDDSLLVILTKYRKSVIVIVLYHGTIDKYADDIIRNGINLAKSKKSLDFGPGFYTTPSKAFAINTAKFRQAKYNQFHPDNPVEWCVVELELDENKLVELKCITFHEADNEWGQFIVTNRCSNKNIHCQYTNNLDARFDVVLGPTADGQGSISVIVNRIDSNSITMDDVDSSCFAPSNSAKWGEQVSFHTKNALSAVKVNGLMNIKQEVRK